MISRRGFLQLVAASGTGLALAACTRKDKRGADGPLRTTWLLVGTDDTVTVFVPRAEMGQRVRNAAALLVAEELEADWATMRVTPAPLILARSKMQSPTNASLSMRLLWEPLREAGAAAREMLISAAATAWGVDRSGCQARDGAVTHIATGRSLRYGALAASAAKLPLPRPVPLKTPDQFRYIGRVRPAVDTREMLTGQAQYGMDVRVPGMLRAVLARPPVPDAKIQSVDAQAALALPGVRQVLRLVREPQDSAECVAVVADDTWSAMRGRDALVIHWSEVPGQVASADIRAMLRQRATSAPDRVVRDLGQAGAVLSASRHVVSADYDTAYLAHAAMEPMNCTARVERDACEIWVPTQAAVRVRELAARITGLPESAITVHSTRSGGGFGRRVIPDYVAEALRVAQKVDAPVQVVFTRTDDLRHGGYHPATHQRLAAAIDEQGLPVAITHRVVGFARTEVPLSSGMLADVPYSIVHQYFTASSEQSGPLPIAPWRSISRFHVAFARESFIDEIAAEVGRDPLELRQQLLADAPRLRAVMREVAQRIGWRPGGPYGIALDEESQSVVALGVAVKVGRDGAARPARIVCAVDVGIAVDPDGLRAQVEGGIVFALSAIHAEITLAAGRVQQGNFDDYPIWRIDQMPEIEVAIIPSAAPPTGAGELSVAPLAPALANAVFAATGKRHRELPFR